MGRNEYDDDVDLTEIESEERTTYLKENPEGEIKYPGVYDGVAAEVTVTDELIRNDETSGESWLQYNGNLAQTGYSPADRITTESVSELSEAYSITTENYGLETNPVVVPGDPPEMYFTSKRGLIEVEGEGERQSRITVHAVNARTGEEIWTENYQYPEGSSVNNQVNRGVTVYGDSVYIGTLDTKIVSFDRETGEQNWATSTLREGQIQERSYITEAPIAYDGKILFGQGGDTAGWTVMGAVDAESGELLWTQRTHDRDGWVGETWRYSSAGAWMSPTVDVETDTMLMSIGNPGPAYNGVVRPGPNNYTNSVIALDPSTGDIKWNHQFAPHELWDYDVHCPPQVFDMAVDGEERRVVSQNWKAGWRYIIDVETGELITRSEPFARQGGDGFFSPPPLGEENSKTMSPSQLGATEWPPDTYSPRTGFNYVGSVDTATEIWRTNWTYAEDNYDWASGGTSGHTGNTSAHVVAQNPATGLTEWKFEVPDVSEEWPVSLAFTGGTTSTGGGVVFHGSSGNHMYALDDETGEELWSADTGGRITASPVVWDDPDAGEQFVAVAANDTIVVYSAE